jgi:hypothetical protein
MRRARLARAVVVPIVVAATIVVTVGQGLAAPADAVRRPEHHLFAKGFEQGASNRFFVEGRVSTYPHGRIKVLRNVSGGKFKAYKRIGTTRSGKFLTRIYQVGRKRTCFKVQVPATQVFRKTTTDNLGCITID